MNSKNISLISALLGVAALAGSATIFSASKAASAEPVHRSLTGTWLVTIQQYDCSGGTDLGLPFQSLLTFGPGGTLIETTANPAFAPGQRGPGHGTWDRSGFDSIRAVSEAFILFTTSAHGPVPEFDTGRQRIEQYIEFSGGDQFNSEATVSFTDPSGTVLRSGCARATGARMDE